MLPADIGSPVRRIAERSDTIVRWTEFDRVVADLRASFRSLR